MLPGGAVLIVIDRCVQGYESLTQKYNQRKNNTQKYYFRLLTKNIIFVFHCYNIDLLKYTEMDWWKGINMLLSKK